MINSEEKSKSTSSLSDHSFTKYSFVNRALRLMISDKIDDRKKGYSLVFARFKYLSTAVQKEIKEKWSREPDKKAFGFLDEIFNERFNNQ